jgi:hypothetical protein
VIRGRRARLIWWLPDVRIFGRRRTPCPSGARVNTRIYIFCSIGLVFRHRNCKSYCLWHCKWVRPCSCVRLWSTFWVLFNVGRFEQRFV